MPHIDALLDSTRGSCFFTKLDLASAYHQLRLRPSDRWKTSFRTQLGQFDWNVVPYGLQGASSVLMRYMNRILTVGLGPAPAGLDAPLPPGPGLVADRAQACRDGLACADGTPAAVPPRAGPHQGVPGACGPLGAVQWCTWTTFSSIVHHTHST